MDYAKCTIDNKVYKANEFENLEQADLTYKRKFLVCKECQAPAYFRKASKSGQAACFGARPHKDNCELASPETDTVSGMLSDEEKEYLNNGMEIVLDLNYGSVPITHIEETENEENINTSQGSTHSKNNGIGNAKAHRRLSTLLRALISDKYYFKGSKQKIDLNGYTYFASTLFKHFEDLTDEYVSDILENKPRTYRAIWGMISDANEYNGNLWLNTGGNDAMSILIEESNIEDFLERFKVKDLENLSGKYVLCIGRLKRSKNDKVFSILENIAYIVIV